MCLSTGGAGHLLIICRELITTWQHTLVSKTIVFDPILSVSARLLPAEEGHRFVCFKANLNTTYIQL